ncbi:hypothetical protein E2C01_083598 [Portunus trituberculatus]|uniref:Secreted protein n=1 Tax=Portunus trituberculatus TaxID=210409 RepID=A0A5B7J266_PORTR|nr:hypothetical protein [Portunus trituberculatus]
MAVLWVLLNAAAACREGWAGTGYWGRLCGQTNSRCLTPTNYRARASAAPNKVLPSTPPSHGSSRRPQQFSVVLFTIIK